MTQMVDLTVALPSDVEQQLRVHAERVGQSVADAAAQIITNQVIGQQSQIHELLSRADQSLAGFRRDVEESGMTDDQLDEFFHHELTAMRREKKLVGESRP